MCSSAPPGPRAPTPSSARHISRIIESNPRTAPFLEEAQVFPNTRNAAANREPPERHAREPTRVEDILRELNAN